jgi:hypothetical protein
MERQEANCLFYQDEGEKSSFPPYPDKVALIT